MAVSLSVVHVLVDDPDAALRFYRDGLGLKVVDEVTHGDFRWIPLTSEVHPDIRIVLSHPRAGRSEEDGDAVAALVAKGELGAVNLKSDDLEATFARLVDTPGVEVLEEPADRFWGSRDAAVRDPAGNLVRIEQA